MHQRVIFSISSRIESRTVVIVLQPHQQTLQGKATNVLRYCCEFMRRISLVVLVVWFCGVSGVAQQISPELFNGLKWRSIGPFRGGRAVAASGAVGGGSTFYF